MFKDVAQVVATSRLGDPYLAEDAVQEAFLSAFIKLPMLRSPDAFPGWFRTILLHCCDRIRSRQDRDAPGRNEDADLIPATEDADPHELFMRHLERAMVRRTLDALPGAVREACIQRYVHARPYEDIARMLNIPKGTVKRRLHAARQQIIGKLQAQHGRVIRVGYLPISDHLLAMVSHARHKARDPGIVLRRYLSWACLTHDLVSGLVDGAFVMVPLAMSLRNMGVPIIYVLDGHHDGSAITVRRGRPVGKLAGMRIALPHVVSTHAIFLHALMEGGIGLDADQAWPRVISPSYLGRHFTGLEIDGFFCAEPWHTKFEAEGVGRVLARSGDFAPGHVCCGLVVRQSFAAQNGQVLHDYVKELLAAAEYAAGNTDECADIQARYTGMSKDIVRHILDRRYVTFRDLSPDRGRLQQVMNMAIRSSVLDRTCDLDGFMSSEYA